MLIGRLLIALGSKYIKILFYFIKLFLTYLLPILANELIKYQRGCDTWQVTAKIAQPCIFLTKFHECMVNCAIFSRNFSKHYMLDHNVRYFLYNVQYILHPSYLSNLALNCNYLPNHGCTRWHHHDTVGRVNRKSRCAMRTIKSDLPTA